jgi:arginase family enzyme
MEHGLAARLVQVGIRGCTGHQREQMARYGVQTHFMKDIDAVPELAFERPVYVSVDLDGLDPAFAPGVAHHEAGGLSTRQVLNIVQRLRGRIVGADVVEMNPPRDVGGITAATAAAIVKELAGQMTAPTTR